MMKKTIIAPVGDYLDELFIGIKEFSTEKVILISPKERLKDANEMKLQLEKFKIPTQIREISSNVWEDIFKEVSQIKKRETGDVIVQVSTGDRNSRCAATSAAFVNGLQAFGIEGDHAMMLPVLKFSYYSLLSDKKMKILETLYKCSDCCSSLEQLSQKTGMSTPLVSYHVNGNLKAEGLKKMGLIDIEERKGKMNLSLSMLGRMLLKGYVS